MHSSNRDSIISITAPHRKLVWSSLITQPALQGLLSMLMICRDASGWGQQNTVRTTSYSTPLVTTTLRLCCSKDSLKLDRKQEMYEYLSQFYS